MVWIALLTSYRPSYIHFKAVVAETKMDTNYQEA